MLNYFLIPVGNDIHFVSPLNRSGLIIKNQKRISSVEEAISYFDLMASYLDELRKIQNLVREKIGYVCAKFEDTDKKYSFPLVLFAGMMWTTT